MISEQKRKFVAVVVLDGWGLAAPSAGNAISRAKTINMDRFWASYPHTQLSASGESVGLPHGEPGNTETGHLNLGAGRIVYQDLARINMSIADGSFFKNQALLEAIAHAKKNNSKLHLMGLVGAGGVHSNLEHLYALIQLAGREKFSNIYLHLFTDGRDSPQTASKTYIMQVRNVLLKEKIGVIASIMGRYWAMDRDRRWERTEKAYFALTRGEGHLVKTPEEAVDFSYAAGRTDEFVEPSIITDSSGKPLGLIANGDAVVFFNFRIDRPRQLTKAFVYKDFSKANLDWGFDPYLVKYEQKHEAPPAPGSELFDRGPALENLCFVMMTEYGKVMAGNGARVAFPPEVVEMPLGRVLSDNGMQQLRVTESEKERFVTFYFNGHREAPFTGEERVILPSPKVATYDSKPEMAANEITETLLSHLEHEHPYSFVLVNYANADMVGHTGNIGSTVKACEVLDDALGKLVNFITAYGGTVIITADHGNAEEMINIKTGQIDTEHNSSPVPFIVVSEELVGKSLVLTEGILADIAPTVLYLLGLTPPSSMTGRDLLKGI